MRRTLVISDIHGCHTKFLKLLEHVKHDPAEDKLILLGDYMDRGLKSKEVIETVKNLVEHHKVVALRGNHDQMFLDAINGQDDYIFLHNGGINTIESYCGLNWFENHSGFDFNRYLEAKDFIKRHYHEHIAFIDSLPFYHEDESHIYVHAGLSPYYTEKDWKSQPTENFLWIRDIFLANKTPFSKTIVFGHTPTINLHKKPDIYFGEGKIGIDGGVCFGYQLNCLEIIAGEYNTYSTKEIQ
ncbi:metallophosphoesterase [Paenibacillus ferrarius]|uniref:Metallophosphoesterase n=1 Tax=Paenibacillus ferrarius TaxID=1469647 RepID=A0A1V4HTC0_9BACL|nr:metallophosphoesterase [Paenibacillus ferrarius]